MEGRGFAEKNELLFSLGHDFATLPAWQRLGSALYWGRVDKQGFNPKTGETVVASRRTVILDEELPRGDEYGPFLSSFLATALGDAV